MNSAKVISVCVGKPQLVQTHNEGFVSTAIFKKPVTGRVAVNELNLEGDAQADLTVHGGRSKSVYVYPFEHYEFWKNELPEIEFENGIFGENLTTEGLLETELFIGDKLRIGTAEFAVTEPRMPCYKLGVRFGRSDIIKRFLLSRRSGFYLTVLKTGELGAGDSIEILSRDENKVSVFDIVRLYVQDKDDAETMNRAVNVELLPEGWKEEFRDRLINLSDFHWRD
ncbi:MAG: MOSC domain-containing protein [Saprospiraceae bacterium]|nr:MOSC domain-containing protein [Pyrinomonadaceae bacterium]